LQKRGYALKEQGALERSESDLRAAIAVYEEAGQQASGTLATAYTDLALLLSDAGDSPQALELLRKAETMHTLAGASKANRLINQYNQARELIRMGEIGKGVALLEQSIPAMDAIAGPAYNRTLNARNQLAQAYASLGRNADALKMVERNLALQRESRTSDPVALTLTEMARAKLLLYAGRAAEALPIARAGVDFMQREYPEANALRGRARWILGETLLQMGRCEQAQPILRSALADEQAMSGAKATANAGEAYDSLGRCLLVQGKTAEALEMLGKAEAQFSAALGADDRRTLRSRIHCQWAMHMQAPSPQTLAALKDSRERLAKAMGTAKTAVIWQLDLLLDELSTGSDATRLTPEQRQRIRRSLAKEAGGETPPRFVGINSFS
jgi:serine/threonine-protein kinase